MIDPGLNQFVQDRFPAYLREPESLSQTEQAVLDAWVLSGVVGNGGFDAWCRSNGHRAAETIDGLRLLGQDGLADVVAAVHEIVGDISSASSTDAAVDALSDEDHDRINGLSEKVWAADDVLDVAMVQAVKVWPDGPTPSAP